MSYALVVEDDPLGADAARDVLASLGYSVHVVPTPTAAAQFIVWSRPDVVLADRCLPSNNDHLLQTACDRLAVPLLDLTSALCLMERQERWSQHSVRRLRPMAW